MVHRLALLVGAVGAAAVLATAMGFGGLFSTAPTAADPQAINGGNQVSADSAVKTVVDTVYVEPTPAAQVVRVNRPARTNPTATTTRAARPRAERERESDGERGGND